MKPELIAFSEYKLGGVQNFYFNLLSNDPDNTFDKKWIFTRSISDSDALLPQLFQACEEEIVYYDPTKGDWRNAYKLARRISNKPGILLANHPIELNTLHHFPRGKKTVVLICHDIVYLEWAKEYSFLIDAFIAHNSHVYDELRNTFSDRVDDIYFLPFGIELSSIQRQQNLSRPLRIAFIARMHKLKGILDLSHVDDGLKELGVDVQWTIIGDGPEKNNFNTQINHKNNFKLYTPIDTNAIFNLIQHCDIFLLPSSLDGTPVALLESMSVGLVPILYEFSPGIKNVVNADIGFVVPVGDISSIIQIVEFLNTNRNELEKRSKAALSLVKEKYNVKDRASDYFDFFSTYKSLKKKKNYARPNRNRLDHPLIPFLLVDSIRRMRALFVQK